MRYQDSRENGKQHRYNQYSYRPYDAMTMDKEKIIMEMVLPLVMRLAATGGIMSWLQFQGNMEFR